MSAPFPELLSVPLDRAHADRLATLVAPLERALSWRDASRIPRHAKASSRARAAFAVAAAVLGGHHLHLVAIPGHHVARRAHAAIRGPRASRMFAHDADALDDFVANQAVLRRDAALLLPVTLATQDLVGVFGDGAGRLVGQSFLHLRRGRTTPVITTKPSPALAWFQARRGLGGARARLRG